MIPPDILRLGPLPADTTSSDRRAADSEGWRNAWHKEMERLQAKGWLGRGVVGGASAMAAAIPVPAAARGTAAAEATRAADPAAIETARLQALAQPESASTAKPTNAGEPWMDGKPNSISIDIASTVDPGATTRGPICDGQDEPLQAPAVQALLANMFNPASTLGTPGIRAVPALETAALAPINLQWLPLVAADAANAKTADAQARLAPQSAPAAPAPTASGQPQEPRPQVRVHAEWTAEGVRLWLGIDADAAVSLASLLNQLQRCAAALGLRVRSVTCNGRPVPIQAAALPSTHQTEPEAFPWQLTQ